MGKIMVQGGRRLTGRLKIQGSKNAVLPILAACVLCEDVCTLYNCPHISDVEDALTIIRELGGKAFWQENVLTVDTRDICRFEIRKPLMLKMRSSVMFLGSVLSRMRKAKIYAPGGCEIGSRPIDIHIKALQRLGAAVSETEDQLCFNLKTVCPAHIKLSFPSVGATENAIMAAVIANGTTVISNAAAEPEIAELQGFINAMGGCVSGAGTHTIYVEGVKKLHGAAYKIEGDRIVCATYLLGAAAACGEVLFTGICPQNLGAVLALLREMGCAVQTTDTSIALQASASPRAIDKICTRVFPGVPTDAQAALTACLATANGISTVTETIFENRFRHISELVKMGANISLCGQTAVIHGVPRLYGATVAGKELRGTGALVMAGVCAEGKTTVFGTEYLDRGYEHIEQALAQLNADLKREG